MEYDASCGAPREFEREYTFWLDIGEVLREKTVIVNGRARESNSGSSTESEPLDSDNASK